LKANSIRQSGECATGYFGYEFIRIVSNGKHFQIGIVESPDNQQLSGRWQLPMPEERAAKPKETRARR
jgi:hypothetical protein